MWEKLKFYINDDSLYFAALLLLISVASFGLGRQSVMPTEPGSRFENKAAAAFAAPPQAAAPTNLTPTPITTIYDQESEFAPETTDISGEVVASKSGTKYHLPTCSGAKTIKPENLVTFASRAEAEAAGYTPAANCKGLK